MSNASITVVAGYVLLAGCGSAKETGTITRPDAGRDSGLTSTGDGGARDGAQGDGIHGDSGGDAGSGGGEGRDAGAETRDGSVEYSGRNCSPGTYVPPESFAMTGGPNHAVGCYGAQAQAAGAAGVFSTLVIGLSIDDIELATPMQAGKPYGFSFEYWFEGVTGDRKFELWGTTATCGQGTTAKLLYTAPALPGSQILCADLNPDVAYSHLLLVYRFVNDNIEHPTSRLRRDGATFCAAGQCAK